jgi:hypothetical protein
MPVQRHGCEIYMASAVLWMNRLSEKCGRFKKRVQEDVLD